MNANFSFTSSGMLFMKSMDNIKLKDVEEFCVEARKLGMGDNAILETSRQGFIGPINGWFFRIPVIPVSEASKSDD